MKNLFQNSRAVLLVIAILSTFDGLTQPTVELSSTSGISTNDNIIAVTALFSDKVQEVLESDFEVQNGNIVDFVHSNYATDVHILFADASGFGDLFRNEIGDVFIFSGTQLKGFRNDGSSSSRTIISRRYNQIDVNNQGRYYVTNTAQDIVTVLNQSLDSLFSFGESGTGNGQFQFPTDIRVTSEGNVVVVDETGKIQVFDEMGTFLFSSESGTSTTHHWKIDIDENDHVFFLNTEHKIIEVYGQNGMFLESLDISAFGAIESFTVTPQQIFLATLDTIIIVDRSGQLLGQIPLPDPEFIGCQSQMESFGLDKLFFLKRKCGSSSARLYEVDLSSRSSLSIEPLSEGKVTVSLAEGAVSDLDGNVNREPSEIDIFYDISPPKINIPYDQLTPTTAPFTLEIGYNEPVNGTLVAQDLTLEGGRVIDVTSLGDSQTFSISIVPEVQMGEIQIYFKEDQVTDLAGNDSELDTLSVFFKVDPMSLSVETENGRFANTMIFDLNIVFSEPVLDFVAEKLQLFGGTLIDFSGVDSSFTAEISAADESQVDIYIEENSAHNSFGLGNPKIEISVYVDSSRPVSSLVSPITGSTSQESIPITVTFDDPVYNFSVDPIGCLVFDNDCFTGADIEVEGGYISNFRSVNDATFTMDLILVNRVVTLQVPENVGFNITDLGNTASNTIELEYMNGAIVLGAAEELQLQHWVDKVKVLHVNTNSPTLEGTIKLVDLEGKVVLQSMMQQGIWSAPLNGLRSAVYVLLIETRKRAMQTKIYLTN